VDRFRSRSVSPFRPPLCNGCERCRVAWLCRNRRLAKDFERSIEASTAMVILAIIQLLIRRLATP
jgi:hypothetical protein